MEPEPGITFFDFDDFFASLKWIWSNENAIFEKEFAQYVGAKYAIGTSFGRTALYLGLRAIDVSNKEVIVPTFICTVVRHAVTMAGGTPRFVDINIEDFTLDLDDLKRKISNKTKAIILPHFFGRVARNMDNVIRIARHNNLVLIEDCAHSLGAEYKGKKIGIFGDFSIFSLTKGMINFGGGVLVTNSATIHRNAQDILEEERIDLRKRIVDFPLTIAYGLEQIIDKVVFDRVKKSIFKWWGISLPRFLLVVRRCLIKSIKLPLSLTRAKAEKIISNVNDSTIRPSMSYEQGIRMQRIIASLGRTQLKKIDSLIESRRQIWHKLARLENCHFEDSEGFDGKDVYTYMVLRFPDTDISKLIETCRNHGLLLRLTWPTHQRLWDDQKTENVRRIETEILTWNVNPMLNRKEVEEFVKIVKECPKSIF